MATPVGGGVALVATLPLLTRCACTCCFHFTELENPVRAPALSSSRKIPLTPRSCAGTASPKSSRIVATWKESDFGFNHTNLHIHHTAAINVL